MPNPRCSLIVLAAAFSFVAQAGIAADKYPEFLPTQYQTYFARYVDGRTLSEQILNAVSLTSNEYGRGFALIAGISTYPSIAGTAGNLTPAGEDIRKLANYLTTYEKFDEIVVLKDAQGTEANLSYFLQRYFPQRLQKFPRSRFLFAYSGHGATVNNKGYLLTADARDLTDVYNSGIPMTTLRAMFQQIVDSGFHVLALINACYSGDFLRRSFGDKRYIPKYAGAHAITAGGTKELAWHDGSIGTGSVFFEKFFAALDGRVGRDGIVTVDDLAAYLRQEVQISTDQQQNPLPGDLSRDGSLGGFFFFNRRPLVEGKLLPLWDAAKGLPFGSEPTPATSLIRPAGEDSADRTRHAALLSQAYGLLNNNNYDQAIVAYDEAIRLDPKHPPAFINRGNAYLNSGLYDRALTDYTEAIRLDPKYTLAFNNRGDVYYKKEDYDNAIANYAEAIRLDPKFALAFANRAVSYNNKKDYDKAIADSTEAIRLDPKFAIAFANRATAYYNKKDYDKAIADNTKAIRLDPKFAIAFVNRATAYYNKKDYDKAIADNTKAIRLDPKYAIAFVNRGKSYYNKSDYERAITDYTEAIRLDPNDADAIYSRGLARNIKGDTSGGAADIARAKQLNPAIGN